MLIDFFKLFVKLEKYELKEVE